HDGYALTRVMGKLKCIPIGQPDGAMRGSLADLVWVRCAMDPVTLGREVDPDGTDGVVWPGREIELLFHMDAAKVERRIIVIYGIFRDFSHFELALGCGSILAAHRSGVDGNHLAVLVEG